MGRMWGHVESASRPVTADMVLFRHGLLKTKLIPVPDTFELQAPFGCNGDDQERTGTSREKRKENHQPNIRPNF